MAAPIRILTAVPVCDGHDSAITTINLELSRNGVEVVYLGYHRTAQEVARAAVQEDVRAGVLVAIPMADAQLRRDLALVFRKDKALSRAALAFIEIARKLKSSSVWTSRSK